MSEKESGFIPTERKEKKPEFAVLTFESGKKVYRENPDKMNKRGEHAFKGVIPEGATIQVRVNFSRPGDFLPCGVLKICDIPNRETKVLNIGLDDYWEIKGPVKTEEGFEIRSWVFANRYSLRNRQRKLREAKRSNSKQPTIVSFPKISKEAVETTKRIERRKKTKKFPGQFSLDEEVFKKI
jgi:hypothetical protein